MVKVRGVGLAVCMVLSAATVMSGATGIAPVAFAVGAHATAGGSAVCSFPSSGQGYLEATADGDVLSLGEATLHGSLLGRPLNFPVRSIASTPTGRGYWLAASDGGVFTFGDARFLGSAGAIHLHLPVVGMASTPAGNGYWLVASDGGIFSFGDARFFGSTGSSHLNRPVVAMAPMPTGNGYWLVASDGGIFSFGDARFFGSTGSSHLNRPVVAMAPTPTGRGYWLVASDGGIFSFGDARFFGSTGALRLNAPVVALATTTTGHGYWLTASDGGAFNFGDAHNQGSFGGGLLGSPVVASAARPAGAVKSPASFVEPIGVNHRPEGDYYYAGGRDFAEATGASAQFCQAPQGAAFSAAHALTELAVEADSNRQVIEIGAEISSAQYGDGRMHLFISYWIDGRFVPCGGGLSRAPVCALVQVSPRIVPNMIIPFGVTSSFAVVSVPGRWNVYYDDQLVGYLPWSIWGGRFTRVTSEDVFGEIGAYKGQLPLARMGNGLFGHDAGAASVTGFQLFGNALPAFLTEYESVHAYYDIGDPTSTSFRYGGPGPSSG